MFENLIRLLAGLVITHIFRPPQVQFGGECPGFAPNRGSERLPGLPGNLADGSCSVGRVPFGHTRRGRFGKELMSPCRVRVRPLLRPARAGLGSPTSRETDPDPDLQTRSKDVGNDKPGEGSNKIAFVTSWPLCSWLRQWARKRSTGRTGLEFSGACSEVLAWIWV